MPMDEEDEGTDELEEKAVKPTHEEKATEEEGTEELEEKAPQNKVVVILPQIFSSMADQGILTITDT